jgi:hypothetical protein
MQVISTTLTSHPIAELSNSMRIHLEMLSRSKKTHKQTAQAIPVETPSIPDPELAVIKAAGLFERTINNEKISILCPFEGGHSDYPGRAKGDGDTVYFLRSVRSIHGKYHCSHASCAEFKDADFRSVVRELCDPGVISEIAKDNPDLYDGPPKFCVKTISELINQPPIDWLIKGLLPSSGLAVLYGGSGTGKTFVTLDIGLAIARGIDRWHNLKVKQGAVLYVAAEGAGGLGTRLKAYEKYHQVNIQNAPLGAITSGISLLEGHADGVIDAAHDFSKKHGDIQLIILDTLNQTMGGGDENSSLDMGKYVKAATCISKSTNALVLIIHHTGKDQSKGARGHSSLRAATDIELELKVDGEIQILTTTKSRDGKDGHKLGLQRIHISLGVDDDLEPITSCVVVSADLSRADSKKAKPIGKWQVKVFNTLDFLNVELTYHQILHEIEKAEGNQGPNRWHESAKKALIDLIAKGLVRKTDVGAYTLVEHNLEDPQPTHL